MFDVEKIFKLQSSQTSSLIGCLSFKKKKIKNSAGELKIEGIQVWGALD